MMLMKNMMNSLSVPALLIATILLVSPGAHAFTSPASKPPAGRRQRRRPTALHHSVAHPGAGAGAEAVAPDAPAAPVAPTTFREGEVLGLRLMQAGRYEDAVTAFKKAMTLPGSRFDILREANVPGPSPVGGSKGGTTGRAVQTLDEFEFQAAHYNMACAHAALQQEGECLANLKKAFAYGFDNYAAVRADPDLGGVRETDEFRRLMAEVEPKFNPFGFFGK